MSMKRRALILAAATALAGGIHTMSPYARGGEQTLVDWVLIALGLFWVFMWLHADQREFGHRRSPWMNLGIVLLSVLFIPIYLARTRPAGRKLAAVGWFFVVLLGWFSLNLLGALLGYFVFGGSAASTG
ncbi:hypothetical protein [Lysobacter sp. CA199]|uniref:hypothetical protein n=1 Tax=Lysobacter sp. CA199 TaxID=3455608 RepID=UPI003F8D1E19